MRRDHLCWIVLLAGLALFVAIPFGSELVSSVTGINWMGPGIELAGLVTLPGAAIVKLLRRDAPLQLDDLPP